MYIDKFIFIAGVYIISNEFTKKIDFLGSFSKSDQKLSKNFYFW